jgi:hemerythrin superfamily protein
MCGTDATRSDMPKNCAGCREGVDFEIPFTMAFSPLSTKSIGERARMLTRAARRSSASARKRVAAAPAAVGKSAGRALDATRSATKSRTAAVLAAAAAGLVTGLAVNLGRKVIVQAPSVMAGDWFEAVRLEHKLVLGLFDAIEATTDAEPAKRMMLLIQLTHALSKHAFTEENVIYPALRDWGDKADADKLNHDHGYVKQHLYELNAMEPVSAAFFPKIATFRSELENHIREEEEAIFPPLHAAFGETGNAQITAMANKEGFKLA